MRCHTKIPASLIIFVCKLSYACCFDLQSVQAKLPSDRKGYVTVTSCSQSQSGGTGYLNVKTAGKPVQTGTFKYDPTAYVLSIETNILFNGNQGIGVSTGGGRDGNGVHYWMLTKPDDRLIDLGDFPMLQQDPFTENSYSALVSSSGRDYQSIRYFYSIRNDELVQTMAVGFNSDGNTYVAFLMDVAPDGSLKARHARKMSSTGYRFCQDGKITCW